MLLPLAVLVGCVSFPLTLALSLRERERASRVFLSIEGRSHWRRSRHDYNAQTPARPCASDSAVSGGRFSLSPRERAGVGGKVSAALKLLEKTTGTMY